VIRRSPSGRSGDATPVDPSRRHDQVGPDPSWAHPATRALAEAHTAGIASR
jgi:hypothetical protein